MPVSPTLNDNALTTLNRVEKQVDGFTQGGGDDDEMIMLINALSQKLETECRRKFHRASEYKERVGSDGGEVLIVNDHIPLVSIQEIKYEPDSNTSQVVDSSDYEIREDDEEVGFIWRKNGAWKSTYRRGQAIEGFQVAGSMQPDYIVTYTGGWITPKQENDGLGTMNLPSDIEHAVISSVDMVWSQPNGAIQSISMDDGRIKYSTGRDGKLPTESVFFQNVVANYKHRDPRGL